MAEIVSSAVQKMYDEAASFASNQLKILFDVNKGISFLKEDFLEVINLEISTLEDCVLTKKTGGGKMGPAPSNVVQAEGIQLKAEERRLQILRDLAYEAEDVLDEVSTKDARYPLPDVAARLPPWLSRTCPGTLSFYVDLVCGCFAPSCLGYSESSRSEQCHWPILFYIRISNRINNICTELQQLNEKQGRRESIMSDQSLNITSTPSESSCRLTTSLVPGGFEMIGRDQERKDIIHRLLDLKPEVSVISIVGMGGMGKTTLAQDIFGRVEEHFEFKKWVYVGMADVELVMKRILNDSQSTDDPAGSVVRALGGKKFLIILDDVWYEEDDMWEKLWTPLSRGGSGSRIIITTQKKNVAKTTRSELPYNILKSLSYDYSLSLFRKHAFRDGNPNQLSPFAKLGEEIVRRLGGLPLAAKVIGSTLYGETNERKWRDILNSISGVDLENKNGVMSVLLWSYRRLPHHLKSCFKYCSLYEKGSRIEKSEIVQMWMAQGYIQFGREKRPEDIGHDYIDNLLSASLFQDVSDGERFVLHDYIHDLAKLASGGEILNTIESNVNPDDKIKIRHLAIDSEGGVPASITWESLRTLIIPNQRLSKDIISQLRCIRVLVVHKIESIEDVRNNLMHLRFLRVEEYSAVLVQSLFHLHNLQTLSLEWNSGVCGSIALQHLSKLTNLRMLKCHQFDFFEIEGVGNLTTLQHLAQYNVSSKVGYKIDELKGLSQLHGSLKISNLQNVKGGIAEAKEALMENKKFLENLKLEWKEDVLGCDEELLALPWYDDELLEVPWYNEAVLVLADYVIAARRNQEDVLEGLRPHTNLKELGIRGYACIHCSPSWMAENVLSAMVSITLYERINLVELPSLGQLAQLKNLKFGDLPKLRKVTRQFYGKIAGESLVVVFRSLEVLGFWGMVEWQEWGGLDDNNDSLEWFPSLQVLNIQQCNKLRAIPHLPSSIRELSCFCTSLTVLPKFWGCNDAKHQLPVFLSKLRMEDCRLLESTGECLLQHQHSSSMKEINVQGCEILKTVVVTRCPKLRTLDLGKVVHVRELNISYCDALDDITWGCLTSLDRLTLQDLGSCSTARMVKAMWASLAPTTDSVLQYPLPNVTALDTDRDVLKAVDPTKLKSLDLGFYKSEVFRRFNPTWWQSLCSLRELFLWCADDLLANPSFWKLLGRLPSVKILSLYYCDEIRSLPEKDLPRSLRVLVIYSCPHLEERYKEGGPGRDILLAHMGHIPELHIGEYYMYSEL